MDSQVFLKEAIHRLRVAVGFLTILPVGRFEYREGDLWRSSLLFPLVGLGIGLANLGAWRFVLAATGDRMIAALTVVLVWIGLTRALHLDGAADIADALFGGWTPEQRRSILADSRLGTFGVVAVFVLLAGKLVFVFGLATSFPLVLAPVLGRTAALYMGILFPPLPLGGKGMGKEISGRIPAWYGLLWVAIVAGFSLAQGGRTLLKTAVIFIMIYLFGRALVRTLEGVNGDGLGAGVEWAEFLFLFLQRA